VVRVPGSDVTYPVVDGIVDFCPDVKDTISNAYDAVDIVLSMAGLHAFADTQRAIKETLSPVHGSRPSRTM
jgi:hypothetical protein